MRPQRRHRPAPGRADLERRSTRGQARRYCQNVMTVYAPSTSVIDPAARPSSPSVRLTELDHAITSKQTKSTNTTADMDQVAMSRT